MSTEPDSILPPIFLAAMRDAAGDRSNAVMAAFAGDRLPAFRANTLKGKAGDLVKDLRALAIPFTKHKLSDWSFTTTVDGEAQLKESAPYKAGRLYSQGIASQLPALIGDVRAGDRVLDCCAAPGGKATLLAMRLGDGGAGLTALDRAPGRFGILTHTCKLMGATRARTLCADAREPPPAIRSTRWDHILVDAPCTGSGTVRIAIEKGWQHLGIDYEAYVASRALIQTALVERAASMLAPGGTLVYSTCSLDPRENEAVIEHLLHLRAPLELVDLSAWGKRFADQASPALTSFRGRTYSASLAHCLRLWPCPDHEGFFVAMLKKRKT